MTFIVMVDGIDIVDGRIGGRVVSGLLFLSSSTVNCQQAWSTVNGSISERVQLSMGSISERVQLCVINKEGVTVLGYSISMTGLLVGLGREECEGGGH